MRFFTMHWWAGPMEGRPIAEHTKTIDDYTIYLATIRHRIPPALVDEYLNTHDSRLQQLSVDIDRREALLELANAQLNTAQNRWITGRVQLRYSGVHAVLSTADPNVGLPGPHGYGDLGYDEVEVLPNGLIEHRFIFSTGIELDIRFTGFEYEWLETFEEETFEEPPNES